VPRLLTTLDHPAHSGRQPSEPVQATACPCGQTIRRWENNAAIGDARAAFFDAASTAVQPLERPELAGHWTDGSALQQFSVAGLAGHLVCGMTTVERYLDGAEPGENGISAGSYFHAVIRSADVEAVIESLRETWSRTRAPRAVVFCRTVAHAEEFAQLLREGWRRSECLNSGQSRRERTILLSEFRDGRVPIVTTVDILNEGVDVPDMNIICFLRVTHSRRIFRPAARPRLAGANPVTKRYDLPGNGRGTRRGTGAVCTACTQSIASTEAG
jgi:hypothetical protein